MNNRRFEDGIPNRAPGVKTQDADIIADERRLVRIEASVLRIFENYLRYAGSLVTV